MAAEMCTKLLHEFITKGAKQIAREQTSDGIIDKQTLHKIRVDVQSTVKEVVKILDEIKKVENGEKHDLDLTQQQRESIIGALTMATFNTVFDREGQPQKVTFTRNNVDMFGPFTLDTNSSLGLSIFTQMASIVVEAVILFLRLIGIQIQVDDSTVKLAIGNARAAVMSGHAILRKDITQIMTDQEDPNAMGKDIVMLVIGMFERSRDSFWEIVKSCLVHIDGEDRAITLNQWYVIVGQISAFIGMLVSTDGTAKVVS